MATKESQLQYRIDGVDIHARGHEACVEWMADWNQTRGLVRNGYLSVETSPGRAGFYVTLKGLIEARTV